MADIPHIVKQDETRTQILQKKWTKPDIPSKKTNIWMKKRWFIGMFVKQYQNYIRTSINPFLEKLVSIYFLIPVLTAVRNRNYKIRKTTYTQTFASFINLHTKLDNGVRLKTQLYAKLNDFIFSMIKRPFIISNILASPAYGSNISQF